MGIVFYSFAALMELVVETILVLLTLVILLMKLVNTSLEIHYLYNLQYLLFSQKMNLNGNFDSHLVVEFGDMTSQETWVG